MVAKGPCVRGELETEQTATYWPPSSFVFSSTSFSFCWAAQWGVMMAHSPLLGAGSLYSILSPTNWLQKLTELPVAPGYIIVWHPPASCERRICTQFNPSTVKVIAWYRRLDAPVPWLTAGSMVNMLHKFLRWSLMIFIIKGFRTIVFIIISTMFRLICPQVFFKCLSNSETHRTLNYVLYWIHGDRLFWFR